MAPQFCALRTVNLHDGSLGKIPSLTYRIVLRKQALLRMGNAVGRAIRVDFTMADVMRGKYTRVCVELNLNRPLLPSLTVLGRPQAIEYEGLYRICFHCGQYSHKQEHCPTIPADPIETTIDA